MQKASMDRDGNVSKVVFVSGSKSTNFVSKNRPRIRTWFIMVVAVVLILGAVVLSAVFMRKTKEKTNSSRSVTEVNLEEGEILTYRVEQRLEIRGGDVQKGTIIADVVIRVLNKTSEEYWFLMKINTMVEVDNVGNMGGVRPGMMDYFLVKLKVASSLELTNANNDADAFELYGQPKTDGDFIRYVYSTVNQLLPAVKRDLYEDIDGERVSPDSELSPEKSLLCPGAVRMHRKANTSDEKEVLIKNNFNGSDLVNVSSEIDLDITYSDLMFINKSNGMVTESRAYLSEQLNFGEPIHNKSGSDVTTMNVTLQSNIALTEANPRAGGYYAHEELAAVDIDAFVKLLLPKSDGNVLINEKQVEVACDCPNASGSCINDPHCSEN
ncbi:uncharacterized protein LOC110041660, partial [Orbicella faveolata]|uniref:uncharacterized protein LOC110041660 n=1 Tax=Orbicella faveolata TaxID=48498 RepID=UPI0009E2D4D9